jgi:GH24 family phage-related lysozyme (muramidase)
MPYLQDCVANIEIFEGIVPWMYLDTKGFVTVAVGELLANPASALALAFVDATNQPATPDAIQAEYSRVSSLPPGRYPAAFYRSPASPTLPHPAIDALLLHHLTYFDTQLSQRLQNYLTFPDPAKLGLLDMIYNLGVTGLLRGFPTFMNLVQDQNWAGAATQCHRNGPSLQRNDWTRQQFLAASAAVGSAPAAQQSLAATVGSASAPANTG